jgi:hypothetical protein
LIPFTNGLDIDGANSREILSAKFGNERASDKSSGTRNYCEAVFRESTVVGKVRPGRHYVVLPTAREIDHTTILLEDDVITKPVWILLRWVNLRAAIAAHFVWSSTLGISLH